MKPRIPLPTPLLVAPFSYSAGLKHVSPKRLRGADLQAPFRGTRMPSARDRDVLALALAFSTRMPRGGFFNSITAARLHGIPLPPQTPVSTLHVAVPHPARATQTRGVTGHSVSLMGDDSVVVHGMHVASLCRTWCELGAVLELADLVAAGDYIIHHELPLASIEQLADAVRRYPGRRGRALLRRALPLLSDRAESAQESRLRCILETGDVSGLQPNYWVTVRGRKLRIDIAIPERRLAIEYQGAYHLNPAQHRKDMTRASILASDEWLTLEINTDDMQSPGEVVERVIATLQSRPHWPQS